MNFKPSVRIRRIFRNNFNTAIILLTLAIVSRAQVQVQTNSGPIEGTVLASTNNQSVIIYYGIPYAQPPVGNLRFQAPKKVTPWTEVYKANKQLPSCYQQIPKQLLSMKSLRLALPRPWSEDCLTLNIWTPNPKPVKAPVIAFIHGGAFVLGSSLMAMDGTALSLEGFILVTMNYRLGAFGFFHLGVPDAPGNVGLMDQNLALQWIKENIEAFGGDPESITLGGGSAGSGSVGYHLLAPKSNGLFKRAVMMAGAPTSSWGILDPEKSIEKSKSFLDSVGCSSKNTTSGLECLTRKHPEDILEACSEQYLFKDLFIPTVDGEFVVEHPSVSVSSGNFNPGAVMVGQTVDEGAVFMRLDNPKLFKTRDGRLPRREFLNVIRNVREGLSELQVEALNVLYTDWTNPDDPLMLRDAAREMYGDKALTCHINEFAESLTKAGNHVYRYVYDHKLEFMKPLGPAWAKAEHGEDSLPLFSSVQVSQTFGDTDKAVSTKFRKYITNFARHGDPNLSQDEFPGEPHWPQYIHGHQYNLIRENSSIESGLRSRECAVWLNLIPLLEANKDC